MVSTEKTNKEAQRPLHVVPRHSKESSEAQGHVTFNGEGTEGNPNKAHLHFVVTLTKGICDPSRENIPPSLRIIQTVHHL